MKNYYSNSLNTDKLLKCYQVAPKRIQQYLDAELQFVIDKIDQNDIVLDLGCGYGRVSAKIAQKAKMMVGIDLAEDNIRFAKEFVKNVENCEFHVMNANNLKFADKTFDLVFCIQNGISAFKISPVEL
ncbi:MAG: class I SAM-dependent methyltransferase, partial [Candidatus Neomarinimicrobiota bacterium]